MQHGRLFYVNPGPHGYGWLNADQRRPRPSAHCWPAGSLRLASHPFVPPGEYHVAVIERVDSRSIHPGERITDELLDSLRSGLAAGMYLPNPAGPSLGTIR